MKHTLRITEKMRIISKYQWIQLRWFRLRSTTVAARWLRVAEASDYSLFIFQKLEL